MGESTPRASTPEEIQQAVRIITVMAAKKEISIRAFNAGLVKLAWSFVEADAPQQALTLLTCLPGEYVGTMLPADAALDEDLTHSAEGLAAWLVARGHVDHDPGGDILVIGELARA